MSQEKQQKTYRAAIVGLGFVGAGDPVSAETLGQRVEDLDGTHAQALTAHSRVQLIAGASRDEGRRRRFGERTGVTPLYADWQQMLAEQNLDLVSVATNSPYHSEIAVACAEAGVRAILCEKPVATRLSDADRMVDTCRRHNTLLVLNHNRRWHPLWQLARQEIQRGALGEVRQVHLRWPSGRLGNIGTHFFDATRHLLGLEAQTVSGALDANVAPDCRGAQFHDPGGWGIVEFERGVKIFVDAPQTSGAPFEFRVVGDQAQLLMVGNEVRIETWNGERCSLVAAPDSPTSMDLAVDEIVHCLDTGEACRSTGEDGRAALEIILGFHASHRREGQRVPLPLKDEDRELEVLIG